jgi:hypothetical protein
MRVTKEALWGYDMVVKISFHEAKAQPVVAPRRSCPAIKALLAPSFGTLVMFDA